MGVFSKPEVTILKESSDAKKYLEKLESLQNEVPEGTALFDKLAKEIMITKAGIAGEDSILFELKNSGMDLVVLHDLYIESEDGNSAQIDYLVITPYANFIIECKNLFGNIQIDNRGNFIRTIQYGRNTIREGIYSPITQNARHMQVLKQCKAATKGVIMRAIFNANFEKYNIPLVVLANAKTVVNDRYAPKEVKNKVIRADQLIRVLKDTKTDVKSSKSEMIDIGEKFLALNQENRKEYIKKFEAMKEEYTAGVQAQPQAANPQIDKKICPRCGRELILRTARKGANAGMQFYGCSGFPSCRYTEKV